MCKLYCLEKKKIQTTFASLIQLLSISDPSGKLNFAGKAIIHADGVDFSNGNSFKIKMDELELKEELGKGQYGTVQKV
jgi:mitogen-activated protein kinase kinase